MKVVSEVKFQLYLASVGLCESHDTFGQRDLHRTQAFRTFRRSQI